MAAISYDSAELLRDFAARRRITFPLLSDVESRVIRSWGLLNESVPPGPFRGIPHPGTFMINAQGVIEGRYFEENYTERYTTREVMVRQFGSDFDPGFGSPHTTTATDHLRLSAWAGEKVVRGGQRVTLALDLELPPKMHVYAPGAQGYIPVTWRITNPPGKLTDAAWPESRMMFLPAIQERVPVFEYRVRVYRSITLAEEAELRKLVNGRGEFPIEGSFRYQACDDRICYLPQDIPLRWTLILESHDKERAPAALRRR